MKHDVTTSLSDVRVPDELKTVVTPDHSYRKVEYARRREYVDSPTCVPSLHNFSIAQIQTEPRETAVVESQVSDSRFIDKYLLRANFFFIVTLNKSPSISW